MKADDKLIFYENAENDGLLSERTVIYVPIKNNKRWKCLTFLFAALTVLMLTWTFCGHSIIGWWHHARIKNDVSFSFANYYGDHMVLQKSPSQANVWGWAKVSDIGSEVTITLSSTSNPSNAKEYKATVTAGPLADRAVWQTLLDPIDGSSESFTIVATLGQQKAQLNDVLFGDVWICSGQSNMQLSVGSMYNASQELDKVANFPNIRLIYVAMIPSNKPEYELLGLNQPWALPTKDTVQGFSAVCWLYGREVHQTVKYPIGLVLSCWGGTRAEAWSSPDALKKCPGSKTEPAVSGKADDADAEYSAAWWKNQTHVDPSSVKTDLSTVAPDPNVNSVLWNGMMHPLSNMTITGAIWYQGEANVEYRTDEYNCTFRAMIEDWRANFNQFSRYQTSNQFAFGFMQLGPNHKETMNATQGFSDIRWHQTSDIGFTPNSRLQNVFMATAMDTEDFIHDIHPRDKITPAHRLALAGLNVAYKRSSIHSRGPTPTAVQIDTDKNTLVVEYDWGQGDDYKIDVRAKFGFDVCCSADGKTGCAMSGTANWYSANIVDFSDYTVTLSWKQCAGSFLMGVRYAWRETPCYYLSCPIYGQTTKLPATPFIYQGLITEQRTLL